MYRKIIVCIDETPLSESAARVGADLACRYDAEVILLSILDPARLPNQAYTGLEAIEKLDRHSRTLSDSTHCFSTLLHDRGICCQEMLLRGRSIELILNVAETESADLIVVGSEIRGRLRAWLHNDLWSEVSHKAPCHVLRVTPPQEVEAKPTGKRLVVQKPLPVASLSAL